MQFMRATYVAYAQQVYGEYREMTPEREWYVAVMMIDGWLQKGYTATQIAATWNSGSPYNWENKQGINKQGVAYDVPMYVRKVLANL